MSKSEEKGRVHIYIKSDTIEYLLWARRHSRREAREVYMNRKINAEIIKPSRSYDTDIKWMYNKLQELSKVLKDKQKELEEEKQKK